MPPSLSDDTELHGHFLKQYHLILEMLAQLQKFAPHVERLSIDAATHARALYDLLPIVETKLDQSHGAHRVFLVDHVTAMEKKIDVFLAGVAADRHALTASVDAVMKTFIEHVIAIRTATALASNAAEGAEDAANKTLDHTGHTGQFHLLDEHGHPVSTPQVGGRVVKEKDTPEDQPGVTAGVVREGGRVLRVWSKMGARPQLLLIVLALIGLAALAFKGGGWHEKINSKTEAPMPAPTPQHREPRLEGPRFEHRRETP